jgi:uncharacterized OB-fold protein
MKDNKLRHYRCPKCGKVSAGINVIPKCKCTGKDKSSQTEMVEIKDDDKKD